ncbi:uncharacterized protein I303_108039 [Kwoniella dejecticola CBS 10117]|uniref:Uncharacterized protein n=1 Tax=Kwoniella dejecticola CBS 10117 TaxID=1296121 RepID=A0A1A5ZWD1_9TREE|nr:uncharacterized protein I303_08030 [Kwoniella dejecticola CBS 10117]OBR82116.1 hypothetical protein I303_08030 [Kwoniella dejecticola CBS 10117]
MADRSDDADASTVYSIDSSDSASTIRAPTNANLDSNAEDLSRWSSAHYADEIRQAKQSIIGKISGSDVPANRNLRKLADEVALRVIEDLEKSTYVTNPTEYQQFVKRIWGNETGRYTETDLPTRAQMSTLRNRRVEKTWYAITAEIIDSAELTPADDGTTLLSQQETYAPGSLADVLLDMGLHKTRRGFNLDYYLDRLRNPQ